MGLTGFRTPLHSRSDACSTDVELHNPAKELLRECGSGPNWRKRLTVFLQWIWTFLTGQTGEDLNSTFNRRSIE